MMLHITFALLRTAAYPIAIDHFQGTFNAFGNITVGARHFAFFLLGRSLLVSHTIKPTGEEKTTKKISTLNRSINV